MALVTYVLGDCPKCGRKAGFGNVDVRGTFILRGCKSCRYTQRIDLPPTRKKVLYLDQFFFSHAFRGTEKRFLEAAEKISQASALQLLVAPYSTIHEEETHQWSRHKELFDFIKAAARGHEFRPAYEVERIQLLRAFQIWLAGGPPDYDLKEDDVLPKDIHDWDSYLRIEVGRYLGDIELIRALKKQTIEGLVGLFEGWRTSTSTFEEDVEAEHRVAAKSYMDFYLDFAVRIARGDFDALFNAPIISMVVQSMLHLVPKTVPEAEHLKKCAEFLVSDHFRATPYQQLTACMYAASKAMVKEGAYANLERAQERLSGFFYDVKHVAAYAPYCDAFVMDQPMAELVRRRGVTLENRFRVKVFSLNNWEDFFTWLAALEKGMTDEHKAGLRAAYPHLSSIP